jgi:DNA-binding SARP family transcriptional activator/tetratricopeptide (TPR) repeat protein
MEFGLLGPLLVRSGGRALPVRPGKQRALLAALLLNSNRTVSVDELAEVLWGTGPPPSLRASLQNYVLRLRRSMGDTGHARIVTEPGGYLITVGSGELDVDRFEALLTAARRSAKAGSWADAATTLHGALSLWRGQPLSGVQSDSLVLREVPRLTELRLQALESRIEAELQLARHGEVIAELRQLTAAYPLRERLHGLLMLALYRDGQQASALAAYQAARSALISELGTEPGRELRELQHQILTGGQALAANPTSDGAQLHGRAGRPGRWPGPRVPQQLPAPPPHFVGRAAELTALTRSLGEASGVMPIAAIAGTAGIGKTALAIHWAHQAASQFPDGQLHADLRGFSPSGTPLTPAAAIRLFLEALGVPPRRIPADLAAQAALYRSLLAGRKMLVVLDNVRDPAQVRPLLPGTPGCLVLVTSRNQLDGLAVADGARLLTLDVLTDPEARELLGSRLGDARVAAEPAAVAGLTVLCARLPLALSVVAARAAARPRLSLAELAAGLRGAQARLDALGTGDAATDVRTVFSWSCQQLSGPAAEMFRLLSAHPGPDITAAAAASLAAVPAGHARRALTELAGAHLVTEHVPGRYECHDLLRAYAAEQVSSSGTEAARRAAARRVLDHYLHTAGAAALLLHPYRNPIELAPPQPGVAPEELADRGEALAWFQAERPVLLAAVRQAAAAGFGPLAWQLPWAVATFFNWHGHWQDLADTQEYALAAARDLGDRAAQVQARHYLAQARIRQGDFAGATAHLTQALELGRQLGSGITQARAHLDLGHIFEVQGRNRDALGHAAQALGLYRASGHRPGEADALNAIGWCHAQLGDHLQALSHCGQALAVYRELENQPAQAATLDSLGYVHHQLGHYDEAIDCFQRGIDAHGQASDQHLLAEMLTHLGDAHAAAGDSRSACRAWQRALAILGELGHPDAGQVRSRLDRGAGTG